MVVKLALNLLVLALAILPAFADPADAEAKHLQWRDRALEEIASLKDFSDEENARKVMGYIAMAMGSDIRYFSAYRSEVFNAARKKLGSMPGHAAFFEKELATLRENEENGKGSGDYNFYRERVFVALEYLQTVEAVELLINLLDDNRDAKTITVPGDSPHTILGNDEMAGKALIGSIKELPLGKDRWGYYRLDIPALQTWGREVLEENRTFQFRDNPGTFNINGKIPEERREIPSVPLSPVADMADGGKSSPSSFPRIWAAAAAIALLLAAVVKLLWPPKRAL